MTTSRFLPEKTKARQDGFVKVDPVTQRVVVQGVNMVKKTMRKKSQQDQGGIKEIEAPIHISNVALVTKSGEATRVGYRVEADGSKVRVAKKTGEVI